MGGRVQSWRDIGNPQRRQAGRRAEEAARAAARAEEEAALKTAQSPSPLDLSTDQQYVLDTSTSYEKGSYADKYQQAKEATTTSAVPPVENWDYKTAKTNPQGEALTTVKLGKWSLTPKGFDPNGEAYFGAGVGGWLKKFAYKALEDTAASRLTADESHKKIQEGWDKLSSAVTFEDKTLLPGETTAEKDVREFQKLAGGAWDVVAGLWDLGESAKKSENVVIGGAQSILSPVLKSTRLVVEAGFDVLQGVADTAERVIGMNKTMRDYVETNGSKMPEIGAADFDPIAVGEKYKLTDELVNTFSHDIVPVLSAYDAIRFFSAPGTLKEKEAALQAGWTENKMLYSELVRPSIEAEYKRRVMNGEDAALLTMELQDPWAELVGEVIFDPLNAVDMIGKTRRLATAIKDADTVIGVAPSLMKAGFVDDLNDIQNISTAAQGSEKMEVIAGKIQNVFHTPEGVPIKFGVQDYHPSALNATGNRNKLMRQMGNFLMDNIANVKLRGKKLDDAIDWLGGLVKLSSKNADEVKEGLSTLQKFPNMMDNFSQRGLETSYFLRNVIGDDVEKFLAKVQKSGDWGEVVKTLDGAIADATHFAYPTVSEMADAAKAVDEAKAVGKVASEKNLRLAEQFTELKATRPGIVAMEAVDRQLMKIIHPVNTFFAGTYFSLSYGFAARNFLTNTVHVFADAGLGAYVEKGKILTMRKIDAELAKVFPLGLPPSLRGETTMAKTIGKESEGILKEIISKMDNMPYSPRQLAIKAEVGAGKRVFYKYYRDTMDSILKAGVGLPPMDDWLAQGFSKTMVDDYVDLIKAKGYNVAEATAAVQNKYSNGVELWRQLDTINPEIKKALSDNNLGVWDEIVNHLNDPKTDKFESVQKFFEDLKQEAIVRAQGTVDDLVGVPHDTPHAEGIADQVARYGDQLSKSEMTQMSFIENSAINAKNQFLDSLNQAAGKLRQEADTLIAQSGDINNPAAAKIKQLEAKIRHFTNETAKNTIDQAARLKRDQTNAKWFDGIVKNVKNNDYKGAWDTQFMGPRELGDAKSWKDAFYRAGHNARRQKIEKIWSDHFRIWFGGAEGLASEMGEPFADLFKKAKSSYENLELNRNLVFGGNGQAYHRPPVFVAAEIGTAGNGSNISALAKGYGISSASTKGIPADKKLLNIINKYSKGVFENLNDVPAETAEAAFKASTGLDGNLAGRIPSNKKDSALLKRQTELNSKIWDPNTPKEELKAMQTELGLIDEKINPTKPYYDETGNLVEPNTEGLVKASPDYVDGSTPTFARKDKEILDGILEAITHVEDEVTKRWGLRSTERLSQAQIDQMAKFSNEIADKVAHARNTASVVGEKFRDFALLPYGQTTNLDHALAYVYPYQFWYSGTYKNWMKRLATNSALLADYAKWKDTMASVYHDQPEWWKYNVKFPDFLGINNGNPMMFNLEASIWPLNGITGTDFNDPEKRTNSFTALIDDMGKFGPTTWAPIGMAIAAYYANKGEKDIAAKWGGRIIPQTALVKGISSYFGKPIELDPNVRIFSGNGIFDGSASDPYEEGRISRALAAMESEGVPKEQLMEAARTHSGELWDEAYRRAVQLRAPGQIMSSLLGVGFRPRTQSDMETDKFYAEYSRARNLHDGGFMSDEQYKQSFNDLREKYPFMDVILLSRRAGMGRDAAYAYNVISRIPPGQSTEVYESVGVDPDTAQKFFDSGGKLEGMSDTEKDRFMASMVDAGAILAIPSNATRREWTAVKNQYGEMNTKLQEKYGDDILEKIGDYYGIEDTKKARMYLDTHPEISQAMEEKTVYIANNPQLNQYYGGIDTLERYYTGKMYDALEKEFGSEILDIAEEYSGLDATVGYDSKLLSKAQKEFKKAHPELQKYWDARSAGYEQITRKLVEFGNNLPQPEFTTTGNEPQNPAQQSLLELTQPKQQVSFQEWQSVMGQPMTELILDYYYNNEKLPYPVIKRLEKLGDSYGMSGDDLLKTILMSLPQQ